MKKLFILFLLVGSAAAQNCITGVFASTTNYGFKLPFYNQCNWGIQGYNPNFAQLDTLIFNLQASLNGKATTGTGTLNFLPKYSGAGTIINSLYTDSGTVGAYTGSGGFTAYLFQGNPASPDPSLELAGNSSGCIPSGVGNAKLSAQANVLNVSENGGPCTEVAKQGPILQIICPASPNCSSATNYDVQPVDIHSFKSLSGQTASMTYTLPVITAEFPSGVRVLIHNEGFTTQTIVAGAGNTILTVASIPIFPLSNITVISTGGTNWLVYDWSPRLQQAAGTVLGVCGTALDSIQPCTPSVAMVNSGVFCSDAGSTDTYACSLSPAPIAYVTGYQYRFKANTVNTGAATINLNSLGAKTIKKMAGGITTDLADNDIRAGQWVNVVYDGTNMQMTSQLGN